MKVHNLPKEEVFRELKSSPSGLTEEEAKKRLKEYGPNQIKELRRTPLIYKFLANFTNLFAILLWVGGALSFIGGMPELGWAIFAVIFINAIFSFWQEYKAEKAIEALKKIMPVYAKVMREGEVKKVLASELVPGDLVILEEGDNISADGRLIEEFEMRTNNATLSGEAAPVRKTSDPVFDEKLAFIEVPNLVFAGTSVATGSGKAIIFGTGMKTEFGKIAHLTQAVKEEPSPLQKEMGNVARLISVVAIGIGVLFFILGRFIGKLTFLESFLFTIGMIIANVPEGLLPTVTLALAMGVQRIAKRKALIKKLSSVETLGSTNVILTDKTGTLTMNEMTVREVWTRSSDKLYLASVLCNNAKLTPEEKMLGDPTEGALLVAAKKAGFDLNKIWDENPRIYLLPFESHRKRMSSINLSDQKFTAYVKGAPKETLALCTRIQIEDEIKELTDEERKEILTKNDAFAKGALRVLAVAYRKLPRELKDYTVENVEKDLTFLGLVGMMDPPRPEVEAAVKTCEKAGIRVIMITGDYGLTAESIARKIGIIKDECRIITGVELDQMSDKNLRAEINSKEVLFARVNPEHKLRLVSLLKEEGKIVAVTGDGVNDAPALKKADIGVAMGITGTDVAKEASEMILMDDNFATIVAAIEEGRGVYANIKKFLLYFMTHNVAEAFPFIAFIMLKIPLPLTVMQVLSIDLGMDIVPGLGLGSERPETGIMLEPPRSREKRLFDLPLLLRAYGFLGIIEGLAGMIAFYFMYFISGWRFGGTMVSSGYVYLAASTMCLSAIITTQVGNVFACRTERESIFKVGFHTNRLVLFGIIVGIALLNLIIYFPPLQGVFNTAPIGPYNWIFLFIFAPIIFLAEELRKLIVRLWYNKRR